MLQFASAAELRAHYKALHRRFYPPPEPKAAPRSDPPSDPQSDPPPDPQRSGPQPARAGEGAAAATATVAAQPPPPRPLLDHEIPPILMLRRRAAPAVQRWQCLPGLAGDVMWAVCLLYEISLTELTVSRLPRGPATRHNRAHVAMLLLYEHKTLSLPKIGYLFNRDHSTVLWATKAVRAVSARDATFATEIDFLRRVIAEPAGPARALLLRLCGERDRGQAQT